MGLFKWLFGKKPSQGAKLEPWQQRQLADLAPKRPQIPKLEGELDYSFDAVGEGSYQDNLSRIAGPKSEDGVEIEYEATLWREPGNPHDSNAIRVDIRGLVVGYIPRRDAKVIAPMMDNNGLKAFRADAVIVGGWKRARSEGAFGVKLDLPYEQQE